ncbi:MAG: alpha/beta hydrolase-fold protein [Acidobacteriota bacterium]
MTNWSLRVLGILLILSCGPALQAESPGPRIEIAFSGDVSAKPLDGRVLLAISNVLRGEPRFQISPFPGSQLIFGVDVEALKPGQKVAIDADVLGYPIDSVADIPPGKYRAQAVLHIYETFHRADGHVLKLPMDHWEGQQWNRSPGNLYSVPVDIEISGESGQRIEILMDQIMPDRPPVEETEYVKYDRFESPRLSRFWGRRMEMGVIVLLPDGWSEHPEARYPLVIHHGHFPSGPFNFRERPPSDDMTGNARRYAEAGYEWYRQWTSANYPRAVVIWIQHPTPYYDDSYAVNSANNGPYGDAITYDLIPFIEKKYHCIGEPWARVMHGGSTGGWISLAVQVFYPDDYNGCWAYCPDPVDFRWFQTFNVYESKNAYYLPSPWKKIDLPLARTTTGVVLTTYESYNRLERVLGSHGRTGEQMGIFQAVFGPTDDEGYPRPLWDPATGDIDPDTAEHWKKYDIGRILREDWGTLGPKLAGKMHIYMGDMDTFYLNNAAHLLEDFLKSAKDPAFEGTIAFRERMPHCWTGNAEGSAAEGSLDLYIRMFPEMIDHILKTAPEGADTTSWRY